jgi:transcriptional regulator with PAS, ATPase and Fis domain
MSFPVWLDQFPGSLTVCDAAGIIIYMNAKSIQTFAADGGSALIGSNLMDCHSEASRKKLQKMIDDRQKNIYTIEKNGVKKIIYQTPWFDGDQYGGFFELSLEIPFSLPHFMRK